jgi:hypothetical protein
MTQEDKDLLLRDLCARLPYGVVYHRNDGANIKLNAIDAERGLFNYTDDIEERECKPYLRPMSSMTKEETKELFKKIGFEFTCNTCGFPAHYNYEFAKQIKGIPTITNVEFIKVIDWLNKKMFDYCGLIVKGLAIAVTEENNPYKD